MRKNLGAGGALFAATLCLAFPAHSQPPPAATERELIYCAELMTHDEREAYRAKMRAARTDEEKAAVRQTHRQAMQTRAKQRGAEAQCEPLRLRLRARGGQ